MLALCSGRGNLFGHGSRLQYGGYADALEAIVVPIKPTSLAKGRLSLELSLADRRRLTLAMLERVLDVASSRAKTLVVTSDTEAADIAASFGCAIVDDPQEGLNLAAQRGCDQASASGATSVMLLHADVPLIDAESIDTMFGADSQVVIARAKDGGTNALVTRPPGCIPFRFGPSSAREHAVEAGSRNLAHLVIEDPKLAFDLDDWPDLEALAASKGFSKNDARSATIRIAAELVSGYSRVGG